MGIFSSKARAKAAAEAYVKREWREMVRENKPYADTARDYYSAVKSWIKVRDDAHAQMLDLLVTLALPSLKARMRRRQTWRYGR